MGGNAVAGTWTSERFPQFETQIRELTKQHRELEDEPLHLAISYAPQRDPQDIFLFEVIGGTDSVSPDKEIFETTFTSTPGFPMANGQQLHLILTNRSELDIALREGWQSVREIVDVIRSGEYQSLWADEIGKGVLERLELEAGRIEGAARG
jgi:hypothetical protein